MQVDVIIYECFRLIKHIKTIITLDFITKQSHKDIKHDNKEEIYVQVL